MHRKTQKIEPITARQLKLRHILFIAFHCVVFSLFLVPNSKLFVLREHKLKNAADIISRCRQFTSPVVALPNLHSRSQSDRFEEGTRPVLIRNAQIWTGRKNGTETIRADILLDNGLIKAVGRDISIRQEVDEVEANGSWVTPGLVDIQSHIGVDPLPIPTGTSRHSFHGIVQPWLRSLDGLHAQDASYQLSIAGGITTSLVLPSSSSAIGGQGFVIKLRETKDKTPSSMVLELPYQVNASTDSPFRWRYMAHACGENPSAAYTATRMDTIWELRQAYDKAKRMKDQIENFCSVALGHNWQDLGNFPEFLKWEPLIDVLRGRVKVNFNCHESVDLDAIVRLSEEFKFPIATFSQASEAYLVPDLLKKSYGKPPAMALSGTLYRYKRETYRSSEFGPRVLAQHGFPVIMKSGHPATADSRHLIYEAQQAYYYGLPDNVAIAAITSNPAEAMGMEHRIGYIKEGYDADLVIWDSHPLALGATPSQVFIDGIQQLKSPFVIQKPESFQETPRVPNFDKETEQAVIYEGLPPLEPKELPFGSVVVFQNVSSIYLYKEGTIQGIPLVNNNDFGTVVVCNGSIICYGGIAVRQDCAGLLSVQGAHTTVMDLNGGSISPGLVSYGSPLGLETMKAESSTNDGIVLDPLQSSAPEVLPAHSSMIQAADGLQFGSRDAFLAYRSGVTSAVSAPSYRGFYGGISVTFSLGARHQLQKGAIIQRITALHVAVRHLNSISVSTQISALRRLLLPPYIGEAGIWFGKVTKDEIPLVVEAHSADIIAALIMLKKEVEARTKQKLTLTISGASEAHLVAKELGEANIGVILMPSRSAPLVWERRRILPGPPLSNTTNLLELLRNNVIVGIGSQSLWDTRNLRLDIAWAAIEMGGNLTEEEALALGSTNIRRLLGVNVDDHLTDLVATRGGHLLGSEGKVVAILSPGRESTVLLDSF